MHILKMPHNSVGMKGKAVPALPHAKSETPRNIKTNICEIALFGAFLAGLFLLP
jgi:hypothetical protein